MQARELQGSNRRLDSWKEIAAFFGREERTVKRWEKERGLPVHRVPGPARSGVFAYAQELSDWLHLAGPESSTQPLGIRANGDSGGTSFDAEPRNAQPIDEPAVSSPGSKFQVARILGLLVAILLG